MQASEMVAALRANEADAPDELFDNYGEQLIAYCWQLLRNEDATLIAVRDTMIVAHAYAGELRDPELIGPWLLALARGECARGMRAAGHSAKTAKAGEPGDAPPAAAMRDEILTSLTDPRQARYRAAAAARVAALDATGFPAAPAAARTLGRSRWRRGTGRTALDAAEVPAGAAVPVRWQPRRRRLHVGGGLLTVGVAGTAVAILLAAGVSLPGATAPAAPAASASSEAAPGGPALADSARPQGRPVAVTSVVPRSPDLGTPGQPTPAQTQQALSAISSQPGTAGRPLSGSGPGGQAPPVPPGMPPVPEPATISPGSGPFGAPSGGPPWSQPPGQYWTAPESTASPSATPDADPVVAGPVADQHGGQDAAQAVSHPAAVQPASAGADGDDGRPVVAAPGGHGAPARAHRDIRPREVSRPPLAPGS